MMSGSIIYYLQKKAPPKSTSKGRWVIYSLGLIIPIIINYLLGITLFILPAFENLQHPSSQTLWISSLTLLISILAILSHIYLSRKKYLKLPSKYTNAFSFEWLYLFFFRLIRKFHSVIQLGASIMESQFGILWAFLFLILFVTLITQIIGG